MSKIVKATVTVEVLYRLKPDQYHAMHCGTICLNDCAPRAREGLEGIDRGELEQAIGARVQYALGHGDAFLHDGIVQLVKTDIPKVDVEPL